MALRFKFRLKGISPLIMHADDVMKADALSAWRQDPDNKKNSKAGDDRFPAWSWQTYCYTDDSPDQLVSVPCDNLSRALVLAGTQITLKKQKTMKEVASCGLFMNQMYMPVITPAGTVKVSDLEKIRELTFAEQSQAVQQHGFSLFVKRAAVGQSKHVRVRPRFKDWTLEGEIEVTVKEIQAEHLHQMFDIAGIYKGLCDWRPGGKTPGQFGRFTTELIAI